MKQGSVTVGNYRYMKGKAHNKAWRDRWMSPNLNRFPATIWSL